MIIWVTMLGMTHNNVWEYLRGKRSSPTNFFFHVYRINRFSTFHPIISLVTFWHRPLPWPLWCSNNEEASILVCSWNLSIGKYGSSLNCCGSFTHWISLACLSSVKSWIHQVLPNNQGKSLLFRKAWHISRWRPFSLDLTDILYLWAGNCCSNVGVCSF